MAKNKYVALVLFSSLLLLAASVVYAGTTLAQSQATVTILSAVGGTTDPGAGTTNYNDGASVTITQTSSIPGGQFMEWIISVDGTTRVSTDDSLTFTVSAGSTYTIQPVFTLLQTAPGAAQLPSNMSNAAIVVILQSAGGTTDPAPGTYAFDNATAFNITAMANSGWTFSHWVISGNTSVSHGGSSVNLEPTDNPYNVNHGYGETYYYQAVFTQSGASTSASPSASIPEFPILAVLLALGIMVIPIAVLAKKRKAQ